MEHSPRGVEKAAADFRLLIALALAFGGSYFLTYHRYASRHQLEAAHPRVREFVARKRSRDPQGRFASDWFDALCGSLGGTP